MNGIRIALLSQVPPPVHGSTLVTAMLIDELRCSGVSVSLIARRFSKDIRDIGRVSIRKIAAIPGLLLRAILTLLFRRPTVIIVFISTAKPAFLADMLVTTFARILRIPLILYVHTTGFRRLAKSGPLWSALVQRLFDWADTVVVLGDSMRRDIELFARPGSIEVIPNAVDAPCEKADLEPPTTVTFFSNLIPSKGALDFIAVAKILSVTYPDTRFVIAGAKTDESHAAEVERAAAGLNVDIVGSIVPDQRWSLLTASTMLLFPSRYPREAQPLTIIEAMAVGLPVVAYDVGGVSDVVIDGVTGVLVEQGDTFSMAKETARLLDEPLSRRALGNGALQLHAELHSPSSFRARWTRVLTQVSDRIGRGRE